MCSGQRMEEDTLPGASEETLPGMTVKNKLKVKIIFYFQILL